MWISKRVAELVACLVAEKTINAELRSQLVRERERFNWIAEHLHEMKLERAELFQRLGLYVQVPEIARVGEPSLPGVDDNYVVPAAGKVPDMGDLMAQARDLKERVKRTRLADIVNGSESAGGDNPFDDVGDAAAAAIGLAHDAAGVVVGTKAVTR
jgi:hypothetical protein